MATIAEMLISGATQSASQVPDLSASLTRGMQHGAELAKQAETVQNNRAQLEHQKQQLELQKFEKAGSWFDTYTKMPEGPAKKAFAQNFIPNGLQALGIQDKIHPLNLDVMLKDSKLMNGVISLVKQGKVPVSALGDPEFIMEKYPELAKIGAVEEISALSAEYPEALGKAETESLDRAGRAENARVAAAASSGQKTITNANTLRDDLTKHPVTKKTFELSDAYTKIRTNLGGKPSPAGDIAGIFNFMRMNDPASTVREGEFATAQNAASVPDQVRNLYNKALKGERLNATQRADFIKRSEQMYRAQYQQQLKVNQDFEGVARGSGVDPKLIFVGTRFKAPPPEKKEFNPSPKQKEAYGRATAEEKTAILGRLKKDLGISEEEARKKLGE